MSTNYWAFRISTPHIRYLAGEMKEGRLRQGWGWMDGQNLSLPINEFVDHGARRNRRMFNKVKKGDIILVPRLPTYHKVALVTATEDWCKGYRYDTEKEGDFRHIFPVKLESSFGRNDSHILALLRSTLRYRGRFWSLNNYRDEVERARNADPAKIKRGQTQSDRLHGAIMEAFDKDKFSKQVCKKVNDHFEGVEWEYALEEVLRELNPGFTVERVGGKSESKHGTDILMIAEIDDGLGVSPKHGIAIQVKDYKGIVGNNVLAQISKASEHWQEERDLEFISKVVIVTNAESSKNLRLVSDARDNNVTLVFQKEVNDMLARYAIKKLGAVIDG